MGFIKIGFVTFKPNNCNEAIKLFYNVIRNDPDDL